MSTIRRHWTCESGNIASLGYDATTSALEVIFRDVPEYTYSYANVNVATFCALINAESVGSFFAKGIRKNTKQHPFVKHLTNKPIGGAVAAATVDTPAAVTPPRHNHPTRDIKSEGICPACDAYHQRTPRI